MPNRRDLVIGGATALLAGAATGPAHAQGEATRSKSEIIVLPKSGTLARRTP